MTITTINKVLIANRGEIALRIMKTAQTMGIKTVAIYTEADAESPHRHFADQAVLIGEGPVADSYLNSDKIIAAAKDCGANAIHPGYGFMSERSDFALACKEAGLIFIGPSPEAIELMGNKAAAKRKMIETGVPCVPGYEGEDQSLDAFRQAAKAIGFPLMVKAVAGGGGKGMRLVESEDELTTSLSLARSEAENAFGNGELILEKAIIRPRHVEVQVFADCLGNTLHLGERDCSVQRRHQKVVEEAPCPILTPELRSSMGKVAVEAAKSIGYEGAGTVEFLLSEDGSFYFLEMNTRLQVEHPVTEEITRRDLVALQFAVAEGRPLGFEQSDVTLSGHAIEVRLYAEDPEQDFRPQTGDVKGWQISTNLNVRTDGGIQAGQSISHFYDPMLAKIIAYGNDREEARQLLVNGLKDTLLFGVKTNRDFLIEILENETFGQGQATTAFLQEEFGDRKNNTDEAAVQAKVVAAALLYFSLQERNFKKSAGVNETLLGWGSPGFLVSSLKLSLNGEVSSASVRQQAPDCVTISFEQESSGVEYLEDALRIDGTKVAIKSFLHDNDDLYFALDATTHHFRHVKAASLLETSRSSGQITAPMHGNIIELAASVGSTVKAGDRLAVLEAMKMQHELIADHDGVVSEIHALAGSQVKAGDLLISIALNEE
jgi:geranyl-CoA carboxylase alpha subunit